MLNLTVALGVIVVGTYIECIWYLSSKVISRGLELNTVLRVVSHPFVHFGFQVMRQARTMSGDVSHVTICILESSFTLGY